MNKESKATIAYIAGRLILKKDTSSIYDYDQAKHINMSGEVNEKMLIYIITIRDVIILEETVVLIIAFIIMARVVI